MQPVNEILAIVTLIIQFQGGKPVGTATGFFYQKNGTIYLVTNRHVVIDEEKNVKPDLLRLTLHSSAQDISKNDIVDIPLYNGNRPNWFTHPKYAENKADIAVITLDQKKVKEGHFIKALSKENCLPADYVVNPGEDVMVIGYPRGLSDSKHNLPIVRSALVSSSYGVHFEGQPFFLIDANLHPGTSGSPVLTRAKNMWTDSKGNTNVLTGSPMYFLGIHSATLSSNLSSGIEPLGLGTVWYSELIEEIIDRF